MAGVALCFLRLTRLLTPCHSLLADTSQKPPFFSCFLVSVGDYSDYTDTEEAFVTGSLKRSCNHLAVLWPILSKSFNLTFWNYMCSFNTPLVIAMSLNTWPSPTSFRNVLALGPWDNFMFRQCISIFCTAAAAVVTVRNSAWNTLQKHDCCPIWNLSRATLWMITTTWLKMLLVLTYHWNQFAAHLCSGSAS